MHKRIHPNMLAGLKIGWALRGEDRPMYRHGMARTPTYQSWIQMKRRCTAPNHHLYARYHGRGITICDRWLTSFENFLADMGVRPTGRTIDRIDNSKGYYPENCRWATPKEQVNNTDHPHLITFDGKTMHVSDWAKHLGIPRAALAMRLCNGWSIDRALMTPCKRRNVK